MLSLLAGTDVNYIIAAGNGSSWRAGAGAGYGETNVKSTVLPDVNKWQQDNMSHSQQNCV
jgi:hypothetical protein